MNETIPIIIPVYNTTPETLYITVSYLNKITKNPIIIINDGSKRKETLATLDYISENGLAKVLNKENGGKIEALSFGLKYVQEKYKPKCVFIQDDDVIIKSKNGNLDEILDKHCKELDNNYPVYVYPVENQIYIINNLIDSNNFESLEEKIKRINPQYKIEVRRKPNFLDDLQNIEHIASTELARKIAKEGLWVNGTASLWKVQELEKYLKEHSKEHYADDLELSILLRKDNKGVKFSDEITLYPELISNFKGFIRQRIKWGHGAYRVFFKYPKEFLKNPLFFSYPVSPILFYSILLSPSEYKPYISLIYSSIIALQSLYYSKRFSLKEGIFKKFKNINKLLCGLYIASTALIASHITREVYNSNEISKIIELFGILSSLGYTLYILNKAGKDNKKINIQNLLFKYIPYITLYNISILPLGLADYLKKKITKKEKTYKISNK